MTVVSTAYLHFVTVASNHSCSVTFLSIFYISVPFNINMCSQHVFAVFMCSAPFCEHNIFTIYCTCGRARLSGNQPPTQPHLSVNMCLFSNVCGFPGNQLPIQPDFVLPTKHHSSNTIYSQYIGLAGVHDFPVISRQLNYTYLSTCAYFQTCAVF